MSNRSISIATVQELIREMKRADFSVEWTVTSEFGPEWIGSTRTITFFLGELRLKDTPFLKSITRAVIEGIPIPEKNEDHVITGQGDFHLKQKHLELQYSWEATIPYQNPDNYQSGTLLLALPEASADAE